MSHPKVFVRDATGLVRQVGLFDALLLNIMSNGFGLTLIYYELQVGSFPGASGITYWATVLCALACVPVAIAYASMSTAMPRSGGDYLFISRVLHPALGVAASLSICFWFWFTSAFFTNWAITVGAGTIFQVMGSTLNLPGLLQAAQVTYQVPYILLFGSIMIAAVSYVAARSNFFAFKVLSSMTFLGLLGVLIWIVLLGSMSNATFISTFNTFAARYANDTDYYHTVIATAQKAGLNLASGQSTAYSIINMLPFAAYIFPFLSAQSAVGGEVKDPGKNFYAALLLNLLISCIGVVLAMWALYHAAGYDFIISIDYIFVNGLTYALPTPPYFTLFAALATSNFVIQAIMGVGFVCWATGTVLINAILTPRWLFAMSLDRVLPEKFSAISKYGTPWVGVMMNFAANIIGLIIYTEFATILASISAIFDNIVATFMVACIAAIFLPYRKHTKVIFDTAPKTAQMKVGGVPVMSIAGLLGAVFLGWVGYMYAANSIYGANNTPSLLAVSGTYVGALAIYYIAKAYRSRQAIDLTLAFREIPPV